jgi:hypothetical protein
MPTVNAKFKIGRGLEKDLSKLEPWELGYTKDTEKLFVITDKGNMELTKPDDVNGLKSRVDGHDTAISNINSSLADMTNKLLFFDDIRGTTQVTIKNTDGTIQKIQHKDGANTVIREDSFTYLTDLTTEVRTLLSNGQTLTYKYHLDTGNVEVI